MNEFCILHQLEETQFLVDTEYDHEKEEYSLSLKFWCAKINGYTTLKLNWGNDKVADYKRTFEEFKDIEKAKLWKKGFELKYTK